MIKTKSTFPNSCTKMDKNANDSETFSSNSCGSLKVDSLQALNPPSDNAFVAINKDVSKLDLNDSTLWIDSLRDDSKGDENNSEKPVIPFTPEENVNVSTSTSKVTAEPTLPVESWLTGGPMGSKNAILVFRSTALANQSEIAIQSKPARKLHITYKVLQAETKLLSKLLDCHGVCEVATNSSDFNLLWTGSHPRPGTLRALAPHQRVNHFPRSYELTRKDRLYKNIEKMQHIKGHKNFDFIPQSFVMPGDFKELCNAHHRVKGPWIVKPVASSRGRGIFIVETPNQVPLEEPVVVAKYIGNPLLVKGHKCDLRLYVVVTSMDPLLIYIYEEGLVRFATVKYDSSHKQLWNPCMHLCNYSINKYHSDYVKSEDPTAENVGHKWTLSALLRNLKSEGKDTIMLMTQIEDLIIKAILCCTNSIVSACRMFVPNNSNCFELFGFDILIDDALKPWLLEVNLSPSLGCDTPLDVRLKSAMLSDLLTLVGIPAVDPVLRSVASSSSSSSSGSNSLSNKNSIKMKFGSCRRVNSADVLSNSMKKGVVGCGGRLTNSSYSLTPEESRLIRSIRNQFDRRGGFVRIFPAMDSWSKYSSYLDPVTGVPISPNLVNAFNMIVNHNFNQMAFTQLFPQVPLTPPANSRIGNSNIYSRYLSVDKRIETPPDSDSTTTGTTIARHNRYERMLSQGHRSALGPKKILKDSHSSELRKQLIEMIKSGKRMTQGEARRTFSQYLSCVLRRISHSPEQEGHIEIVLKFLQKASHYLKAPFVVKIPSHKLSGKDRAAIVAKQLNDFLYLYNRETEMHCEVFNIPSQIPCTLFTDFLEHARECDLEEVLTMQSKCTVPKRESNTSTTTTSSFQGILKCLPSPIGATCLKQRMTKKTLKALPLS